MEQFDSQKDFDEAQRDHELHKAYEAGWRRGVWLYAIHRDGELLVGCLEHPYKEVIAEGPPEDWVEIDLKELKDAL